MRKYIHFKEAGIVTFPKTIQHSHFAKRFPADEVLSAGIVMQFVADSPVQCRGESVTLQTRSNPKDTETLRRELESF